MRDTHERQDKGLGSRMGREPSIGTVACRPVAPRHAVGGVSGTPARLTRPVHAAVYPLDRPLPAEQRAILVRDLIQAHCGLLSSQNPDGLMLSQRPRDATMAARLASSDSGAGALLLCGRGHAWT